MKNWSSVFLGICVLGAALIFSLKSPEPAFSQVYDPLPKQGGKGGDAGGGGGKPFIQVAPERAIPLAGGALIFAPDVQQPPGVAGRYQIAAAMAPGGTWVFVCDTTTGQTWTKQPHTPTNWSDMGTPGAVPKADDGGKKEN
jgi:hypothetical protein